MTNAAHHPRIPGSTYRLQLHGRFTFEHARQIADYLHDLGITDVYTSPILAAAAGSTHGYDVIDHSKLNPELKPEHFDAWIDELRSLGMGYLLDVVPNHVGVDTNDNPWWNDLLENGPDGAHGRSFDVDWEGGHRASMRNKILLPVLGQPYGDALAAGEIRLVRERGEAKVAYFDKRFPVSKPFKGVDVEAVNANVDDLDRVLCGQFYRLAYWLAAGDEINYRRFFDVNTLAAIAMERLDVFEAAHQVIFRLLEEGKITGLRLDHPDGLFDPAQYFERLQQRAGSPYVLAEKILAMEEPLRDDWKAHGTSGYDFLIHVNALQVHSANEREMTAIYDEFTGEHLDVDQVGYESKLHILENTMASELHMLTRELDALSQLDRRYRDFTFRQLRAGLREVVARFEVYRTYITEKTIDKRDAAHVRAAVTRARETSPQIAPGVFNLIEQTLLRQWGDESVRARQARFAGKFQQLTSPVTAKGIEDTAFYRYHRLISLNEVGGQPGRFGIGADVLHRYFAERQYRWPGALSTLSTHDTKRAEDVRARINVLSEWPAEWREQVLKWREVNGSSVHPNDEYLLYQTLVGAWVESPDFADRIKAYMTKALREAKQRTNWTRPDESYERAVHELVDRLIHPARGRAFQQFLLPFQKRVAAAGVVNSLSQTALKLWAPGVPDTYQGTELTDLSLVDPDNRRPVDFDRRRRLLNNESDVDIDPADLDRAKLRLHVRSLQWRRQHRPFCVEADYRPLTLCGPGANNAFAFARIHDRAGVVVVVPRLVATPDAQQGWRKTTIRLPAFAHGCQATDLFSGERTGLREVAEMKSISCVRPTIWIIESPSGDS